MPAPGVVAYNLASRTILGGQPVLRAANFPVYQTRLTKAGEFQFEEVGHGQKAPLRYGRLPRLTNAYDHWPFEKGLDHWKAKHEVYAEKEAREILSGGRSPSPRGAWPTIQSFVGSGSSTGPPAFAAGPLWCGPT